MKDLGRRRHLKEKARKARKEAAVAAAVKAGRQTLTRLPGFPLRVRLLQLTGCSDGCVPDQHRHVDQDVALPG